ncbi:MAG: substrate-binding domain-containing protein, partial [Candidatus Aureabacteria bacterium]|nr:substrate-binding domain-containing protein [Candidatus Auribacterota bacterium]
MKGRCCAGSALILCALLCACGGPLHAAERLRLATTTSTADTGLLDVLLPPFEKQFGVKVDVIPVGTGNAIALARRGDADVILVHAPEQEEEFVRAGHGVNRREVMYNDFLIVGPPRDPAGIKGGSNAVKACAA